MSVIGSLIFCQDCGDLLENQADGKTINCVVCSRSYDAKRMCPGVSLWWSVPYANNLTELSNLKVVTKSADDAFPSALKLKQSAVKTSLRSNDLEEGATIKEKCPKCGNEEMQYHTLQLRSADEGATVFYTCTECGYRFRTNNWALVMSYELYNRNRSLSNHSSPGEAISN